MTIRDDIFDVPTRRSEKVIGTSTTLPPVLTARCAISIWNP